MTIQAKIDSTPVSLVAAADLSLKLWRFGKMTATGINVCTVAGERAAGVIGAMYKKTPAAGDWVDFYIERIFIVEASGVIAVDDPITTDANGKAKTAGAGDVINGYAVDAATADTQLIRMRPARNVNSAATNVTDGATSSGQYVTYTRTIADAATADYDVVITEKVEVLDVTVRKQANAAGANANTVQVKNTAAVISDAISVNGKAVGDLVRAANINPANNTIAAGGTMRVTVTKAGGDAAVFVEIKCIKRT